MKYNQLISRCNYFYKLATTVDLQNLMKSAIYNSQDMQILTDYLLENGLIDQYSPVEKNFLAGPHATNENYKNYLLLHSEAHRSNQIFDYIKKNYILGEIIYVQYKNLKVGDVMVDRGIGTVKYKLIVDIIHEKTPRLKKLLLNLMIAPLTQQ